MKSGKTLNLYYDYSKVFSYNKHQIVIIGDRGHGKSYGIKDMLSSREVRAYHSGSKVFNEGLRKYLTDVFRRQIKRSSNGNDHSTRTLNFQNKVVANYEMVEEVNGELYHDILLNKLGVVIKDLDTKNAYN